MLDIMQPNIRGLQMILEDLWNSSCWVWGRLCLSILLMVFLYCLKLAEIFLVSPLAELQWLLVFGGLSFPFWIPPPRFLQRLINQKGHTMSVWEL